MSGHNPEDEGELLPTTDTRPEAEKLASSIVPYARDDARARYLSLRASGFTIREALKLIGYVHSALSRWRMDEQFVKIENRLSEYRKELSHEYAGLEFIRNYRLVLDKDFRILKKSLYPETTQVEDAQGKLINVDLPLAKEEQEYLLKMRGLYTPQQLQIIQSLANAADNKNEGIDFTAFVIEASKTVQHIRMSGKGPMPAMQKVMEQEGMLDG